MCVKNCPQVMQVDILANIWLSCRRNNVRGRKCYTRVHAAAGRPTFTNTILEKKNCKCVQTDKNKRQLRTTNRIVLKIKMHEQHFMDYLCVAKCC